MIFMKKANRLNVWKKIAGERIEILSLLAKQEPAYSQKYKELIGRIAKKYRIKVGKWEYHE